ncbi:MAG TPA: glycosyltransferase family 2 protein [Dissulfurispiraceae bacterium]|nr:glycosyltransferase family 2 protein [Dissulfurispiraceae bacterium]
MSSDICVVIPAFNAADTVGNVVQGALKYIPRVIVADDGSSDHTADVAAEAGAEVIVIGNNRGKGNALKALFQKADDEGYAAVISMDADGQHDPEEIPQFLEAYKQHPDRIIVGTRMHEKEKIPRARYNSMHIARFYISLVANQFVEDTQCGFRLYPLSIIKGLKLVTEKYVTETELLMKAGDMGRQIEFVKIKTIYGEIGSHFRPITDVTLITAYVVSYVHVKWLIEGVTSNNPNTYSPKGHLRDAISRFRIVDNLFQTLTAFSALPASIFYLLEYIFLPPLVPNNFASVRKLGCGFAKITLATQMLPVTLLVAIIQKLIGKLGFRKNLVDGFILRFYPHLW